jgi:hypothetical protein
VLWNPGTKYELFVPGLEKTFVSRKQAYPPSATATASAPVADSAIAKPAADSVARAVKTAAPITDSSAVKP